MNLDTFIKEALTNIIAGIIDAQEIVESKNAYINPVGGGIRFKEIQNEGISPEGHRTSTIEFDLSVTVQETNTKQGEIGVKISIINLGVGGDSATSNLSVNKIKFSIPVLFPFQEFKPLNK